jgi:hypothetical protein
MMDLEILKMKLLENLTIHKKLKKLSQKKCKKCHKLISKKRMMVLVILENLKSKTLLSPNMMISEILETLSKIISHQYK